MIYHISKEVRSFSWKERIALWFRPSHVVVEEGIFVRYKIMNWQIYILEVRDPR